MVIMPKVKEIKTEGRLILKEIDFKNVYYCKVRPHSDTSSKIYLPKSLEGKHVYVIVDPEGG
jgi:putative transposon-encoded protein